ncbi:Transposase DDE domain-containing protein [Cyclobacterium xiamenense]|uniref:Transposase DDE domain-containing protein n=1 Tax=Cyclobacterium xiamenense TaxID=1297121 RepID=A0A1H7A4F7_9BACT|nr:transposase [Cyclobacterium xiamenense]SEJ60543.1 Transposase DDE domain-containing protein [Cyclobacterium xiamenense]
MDVTSQKNYILRSLFYPEKVSVDKLYATRQNRKWLYERGIKISAKPLGRPSAKAVENHISPGERNPIEGLFGRAKTAYGMDRIRTMLARTSESRMASIILVLKSVCWIFSQLKIVVTQKKDGLLFRTLVHKWPTFFLGFNKVTQQE